MIHYYKIVDSFVELPNNLRKLLESNDFGNEAELYFDNIDWLLRVLGDRIIYLPEEISPYFDRLKTTMIELKSLDDQIEKIMGISIFGNIHELIELLPKSSKE